MKVMVTGATGYIGGAVARALVLRGDDVVGLVRNGDEAASRLPEGVRVAHGDLADAAGLRAAAMGVDGVVHAASSNDERAGELDRIAVSALLDELAGSGRPLVYTSGVWLHGDTGGEEVTEDAPFNPPLVVSWRPAIEELVREGAGRGVRTVCVRPALVYGDRGGFIPMLLAPIDGAVRPIDGGANHWPVVHVTDLADLYLRALDGAPAGSVYLGSADQPVRFIDAARAVAKATGSRIESWPREQAEQTWSVMVEAFLLDQAASGQRARRELGWDPSRPTLLEELAASPSADSPGDDADAAEQRNAARPAS